MKKLVFAFTFVFLAGFAFSQTQNFWTKRADYPGLKRTRAVAFTVDDYAYVGTGVDTAEAVRNDFWKYDPIMDSWSQVADMPGTARRNAVAFSIGSYGYVGTGMSHNESAFGSTLSDFWKYNPALNNWSSISSYPGGFGGGIYFATGFSIGNKGYVCGGKMGPNNYTSQLWEYNPTTDQWTQKTSFPGGVRYQLCSFTINNSAFVGLGTDNDMFRDDIWEYKPSNDQWIQRADLPASERSGAATFTIDQRGYVCMGNNGGLLDDLWEYNPYEDHWEVRDNYSGSRRKWAVGFDLLGKGYVGLGDGYSGKKQSMYMYTPLEGLGVDENDLSIDLYPNPTTDYIYINSEPGEIKNLKLYNSVGQVVLNLDYTEKINVEKYLSGSYILAAFDANNNLIGKETIIIR